MSKNNQPTVAMGKVHGTIAVSAEVAKFAAIMAEEIFAAGEAQEFCGDAVELFNPPAWAPSFKSWFPKVALEALGLKQGKDAHYVLGTYGVDKHTDSAHGPVLIWVLHNDRLKFRQGKEAHATQAGEWYVFDDRVSHAVRESSAKRGVYLCWAVPLQFI